MLKLTPEEHKEIHLASIKLQDLISIAQEVNDICALRTLLEYANAECETILCKF